jgi:hypothetical protein
LARINATRLLAACLLGSRTRPSLEQHAPHSDSGSTPRSTPRRRAAATQPHPPRLQNHQKISALRFSFSFPSPLNNANFHILGTSSNAIYEVPGCSRSSVCGPGPNRRFSNRMERDGVSASALDLGCGSSLLAVGRAAMIGRTYLPLLDCIMICVLPCAVAASLLGSVRV